MRTIVFLITLFWVNAPVFAEQQNSNSDSDAEKCLGVSIDDVEIGAFETVTVDEASKSADKKEDARTTQSKPTETITLTFENGSSAVGDINSWVKDVYKGESAPKELSVEMYDDCRVSEPTFNLVDTFPLAFDIWDFRAERSAADVVSWTLEIRTERLDLP